MSFKAGESPKVAIATQNDGPGQRSKYVENFDLNKKVSLRTSCDGVRLLTIRHSSP